MGQIENCLLCKSKTTIITEPAIPRDLSLLNTINFTLQICDICLKIKKILDSHISLTTGETHTVQGIQQFIPLNEYWSDWSVDLQNRDKADQVNVNLLKEWNTFSYATRQLDFQSSNEALAVMLDYRKEYKKNFHVMTFRTYKDVLMNIVHCLNEELLTFGKLELTTIDDPIYGNVKLHEWIKYNHVRKFLKKIIDFY